MAISSWSTTSSANVTVNGVNIAEGCPAGNVNNALREIMADVKTWTNDPGNLTTSGSFTLTGTLGITNPNDMVTGSNANGWSRFVNGGGALYIQAGSLNSGSATKQAIIWANMYSTTPRLQLSASDVLSDANGYEFGWKDLVLNAQAGAYTLALTDRGKLIYFTTSSGGALTIPPNSSVAFPLGTRIRAVNDDATASRSITRGVGVSLLMAGNSANQDRTLATAGMCELVKVNTDTWYVTGSVS